MLNRLRSMALFAAASLAFVGATGCDDGIGEDDADATEVFPETTAEAQAIRALLNDPVTTTAVLTGGKVTSKTAKAILAHRDGADGALRSADDDLFDTVSEVDAISGVGSATLKNLSKLADARGYLAAEKAKTRSVIFSPQSSDKAHTVEVARLIGQAQRSIDIAMYSYSDAGVAAALADAVKRGVKVRFVFETASEDRKLMGTALTSSKSGKLETAGVDVRWVNKIMHHKFMIVDGPRDDIEAAKTATLVSGSANWSSGAGTKYDENTMYLKGYPELTLRMQREFNLMWEHSKDFAGNPAITTELSTLAITDDLIPEAPGMHVFFTSANFPVKDTTFSTAANSNAISDQLVAAIDGAEKRIVIASGHLRSRPVAEALMKKRAEDPSVDIQLYLDGQEYISDSAGAQQVAARDTCLAAATTEAKKRACLDKEFLYGREVEKAGVDVRYKYYAYRWDASYAPQMHNKIFIVDDALFSGSYNLSDNAEHNTFENLFVFRGPEFRDLVESYATHVTKIREETGSGLFEGLMETIDTAPTIPIVFPPMSLTWTEIRDLKALIAKECPAVNSMPFRTEPTSHQLCTK